MEQMALTERDLEQVGQYVQAHIFEWIPVPVLELSQRIVRVEEELKHQRELMLQGFANFDRKFDAVDRRFDDMNKRFEDLQRYSDARFAAVDKRFDDVNKRFTTLTWLIGGTAVLLTTLMSIYNFVV